MRPTRRIDSRAWVPTDQMLPATWDQDSRIVRISRVSMVSKVLNRIRKQEAVIVRNRFTEKAAGHLTRVTVVDEVASNGDPVKRVVKLSQEDHFLWAAVYLEVAMLRVADGQGSIAVEKEPAAERDSFGAVGGMPSSIDASCGVRDLGSEDAFSESFESSGFDAW